MNKQERIAQLEAELAKLKAEPETDWENLLTTTDVYSAVLDTNQAKVDIAAIKKNLNEVIYEEIKPVLDENAKLNRDISDARKVLRAYESKLLESQERIAELDNLLEVPFELDLSNDICFRKLNTIVYNLYEYCYSNNITQTKIKRILLEMEG
jgi:chromosome segregation ATPase